MAPGTAAVIQPINGIVYEGKEYKPVVPFDDSMLQVRLTNFLIGVQYGDIDHPWSHVVPPLDDLVQTHVMCEGGHTVVKQVP